MGTRHWLNRRKRTHEETTPNSPPSVERLEPRVLLNADLAGASFLSALPGPVHESAVSLPPMGTPESAERQFIFVDAAVPDSEVLLRGLSLAEGGSTRVVRLDARRNGVEQITEALAGCHDLAAIHIFSHGARGTLLLGNAVVDVRTMEEYAGPLRHWGAALAEGGDILLYGCSVAEGEAGTHFLDRLRTLTGADIAASDDPTGSATLWGDWNLESTRGTVETAPAFDTFPPGDYNHVLLFTLVVLPDTQKYAEQQLQPFFDQTQWIADHAVSNNIAFVSHVGDVVENGALYESEWLFADAAMDILDGTSIPYSVLVGNHDYDIAGTHSGVNRFAGLDAGGNPDPALADIAFGAARYEGQDWFLDASDDGLNYCQTFTADGQQYLHLALEWEPRPSSVVWAQQQIDAYPHLPVILSTHYYIDPLVPGHFLKTYSDDGLNGEELYQALVYPNPQIFMVLSGHNTEWHQVSTNEAGFEVIEMMADYQSRPNGGNGWLQLITFDPDLNQIGVQTYSPTLDQFEVDGNSQFSFAFDFNQRFNFILAPTATLVEPVDQGPEDKNPAYDAVLVNTEQARFRIQLTDVNDGIDDATVTSQTLTITRDDVALTESVDYSFSYDPVADRITLTPIGDPFGDGLYAITFNSGTARIADVAGNELTTDLLTVQIDTSIPHVVTFQQGVNGYAGAVDTDVRGSTPDSEYSAATSIRADAENSGSPIHGLLRFEDIFGTGPGQIPAGAHILSARLEFAVTDNGNALQFHRMLRGWAENETWNSVGDGIQANGIEAVAIPDATTGEVVVGTLSFDVTASLLAWANNPTGNLGWAILPLGSNGVMLDSSEGATPPKLVVTFSGTVVDTTPPTGALVAPLDQGPGDLDPVTNSVVVSTTQSHFELHLEDLGQGIDDATVTSETVALRRDGILLTESADYSFSYAPAAARITLTPAGSDFSGGHYEITLNGGDAKIADVAGNNLITTTLTIEIDTSIPQPQTVAFQQGVSGYMSTVDTDARGSTPDSEYSTATSIRADAENGGSPIHGLLRFDDIFGSGPGQIPIGALITSARLEFRVTDNGNPLQFHRMLRGWAETETWNTLGAGIQANGIEAVASPDTTTAEILVGTLSIDVTASLIAWANDPSSNLGWALLPIGPNGVMLDSSEGATPPKLSVTFNASSGDNAPPTVALDNPVTSLAENTDTTARIKVADIIVNDDESGTNVLSVAGADASLFEIEGTSLYLRAGATLDHETNPTLEVTVEVNDPLVGLNPDDTAHLVISITDVNEPPMLALVNPVIALPENADTSVAIRIADIVITDDALGTNVLSLTGADAALFEIDGTILCLKAGTPLDSGTNPTLDVTVMVDDPALGSNPEAAVALAIQVTEANNAPTVDLVNVVTTLPENTDTSTRIKVADIVITDDAVGTEVLSLAGVDAGLFEIEGTTLYLKAGAALDYETNPALDVIVAVDDPAIGANPDDTAALTISITDANEPPAVALVNAVTNLPEDTDTSVRIKVADILVTDDALGTNVLSLTGADAALFEVEGTILYLRAGTLLEAATNPVLNVTVALDDPAVGTSPDAAVALAIAVGGSTPQTVTFQQGVNGYAGTVDTDVQGSTPDTEYSADTSIRADAQSGGSPIHGLLRFENIFGSAFDQIPVGAQINSAWLEFRVTDNGNALRFHRLLRNWAETETWNTLGAGIQATDVEAVSTPDATTAEVIVGTLSIDVTASLTAWANDPSSNFGWALLPLGSNGVMLDSSEGLTPPKLTVTFGGTVVDTTAPAATLIVPRDQGPNDLDPAANAVSVNTSQPYFQIRLEDAGEGLDDATVTPQTVILIRNGIPLTESVDYSFSYDPATGGITLAPVGGTFGDGLYQVTLNSGVSKIADLAGNPLATTLFTVSIDTSISLPQTVIFQQGVNGYAGTLDTDVQGSTPNTEYSADTSIRADAQSGGFPIHGLLRFDDIFGSAPGQIPLGTQINSAWLEFRVTDNGNALNLHRMLRDWAETETWNTLGAGIQATDVEAVSTPDATTAEVTVGTLAIDVTASLIAWTNDPSSNLGWALLPLGSNGVMLDSSEGGIPPRLTVTFTTSSTNNPPAVALENTVTTLAEDTDTSTRIKVADLVVTDDGLGTNVLSLAGADAALFEIEGTELYLKAGATLDYETNPLLNVIVEVDDATVGSTPDTTAALAITIVNANHPPTVALENTVTTLAEDADTSTRIKVADIVVTDDGLGTNVLSLAGADAALFEIEGTILYLKAGTALDTAANPLLDVIVAVDDPAVGTSPDGTAALAISITPVVQQQTFAFQQGVDGYAGTLDTDVRGDAPDNQYSTSVSVKVDGTNVLYPIQALLRFDNVFGSEIGQIPAGAQIVSAQLDLTVTDAGSPLSLYRLLRTWVETETWNTLGAGIQTDGIEVLSTPDASTGEVALGTLSIDVTTSLAAWANDPSTNFGWAILMADSNALLFGSSEGTTPPKLTVIYTMSAVNQPPTVVLENTMTTLTEDTDTSAHIKVADIVVTDDGLGTNVLSLAGADAALFEIEGTELYLKAGVTLDYETNPLLDVTVEVDDATVGSTPDAAAALTIRIVNVNHPPTVALENTVTTLAEDADTSAHIKIADIVVTDDDSGTNMLSLSGADAALFEIIRTELYLKAGVVLDYQTNPILDVTVVVDDPEVGESPDSTAALTISITPVVQQQTVAFQQGVDGYAGTLDTDIRGDAPNNQYSPSVSVRVDGKNLVYPVQALLRFDNIFGSEVGQIPAGAQIVSAQLELTVTDAGSPLSLYRLLRTWVETETWNTLGAGIQTDGIETLGTPDASTSEVALGTLSIDVTTSLAAWANDPSTNFGWALLMADSNALLFGSSEGAAPPKLTVTYTTSAVNQPPTVALENTVTTLAENTDTSTHIKVADIVVIDDGLGTNTLSLGGVDAALFEIEGTELYLKAGATLDYETHSLLDVIVQVDDFTVGASPDGTAALAISVTDVPEVATYYVSQSGSGNGQAPDAPASIASFNAGTGSFGMLDNATIYFLGTITTTISPADSGTAEFRVTLRGDYPGQECTIDGAGALAIGIDVGDHDYVSVIGFTVQNTTGSGINIGSAATGTVIENCTILQTAGRGITLQSPATITANVLTATGGTQSIYSLLGSSGGAVTITGNTLNFNHMGSGLFIDGYGDHVITNNEIHLSTGAATLLDAYATTGETGSLLFSGNDIDSSVAPSGALVSVRYGGWAVTISDNTFDLTAPTFANDVIHLSDLAGPVVSGNTIRVADDVPCIHLDGNGQNTVATITNNTLVHTGGDGNGYIIRVGEESISSFANTYDGVAITDNLVTGFDPVGNCHAVFVGFNRNAVIARNYISNAGYGVVVKGTEGTDYTAGGVMHNVIYNCDIGLRIKGVDDVVVVNNTIYAPHALILTGNVGGDESTGVVLKNNIFSGTGGTLLQIGSNTDLSTIDTADYATNCLYAYPPADYVKYRGVSYTYAQWIALGYDNGSINANPLFTNVATGDLTLASGSACIDAGTNLGTIYDDGLDPLSLWPLSVNTLDQDEHGSGWEIGAYVAR